ncbi:MAG: 2-amino-4-hydroxy-6-hydroxymethyldihydropteridine diphosphokinase [Acidobacteriota bacterium]|nr:2-amino-4-hydroxy-6-hydroxymethyldihydropteridine diphosphokinase [Acidobacteriota bacterium]
MKTVFLGLGSNMGDREKNIRQAVRELNASGVPIQRLSPIYETEPEGITGQPLFLNAVAQAETNLFPPQLLSCIHAIEARMKRVRTVRNGPRTIDIDIIFYQSAVFKTKDLEIPHPRFRERRFVLAPLADLVPNWRDPVTHRTVSDLLEHSSGKFRRI